MTMGLIVEREHELAQIDAVIAGPAEGEGCLLVIEGEPGIGKTELLAAARERAADRGFRVLHARASPLESGYAYGVVRQLLSLVLLDSCGAGALPSGVSPTAQLARPALAPAPGDAGKVPDVGAVLHGLYWFVAELSAQRSLLLAIDDLQWADAASLRFIAFLAGRLASVPVLTVAAVRTGERDAGGDPLSAIGSEPSAVTLRPQPISADAVAALIGATLAGTVEPAFAAACRRATGGVPFLLRELLQELARDGIPPTAAAAGAIDRYSTSAVADSTRQRLSRIGGGAAAIAEAVAVLGTEASVERIAELCAIAPEEATELLDRLVAATILRPGRPVEFLHPLLATSVEQAIPPYRRGELHDRTAALLFAAGAAPEAVASHLLLGAGTPGAGQVELLTAAARRAVASAAPEAGIAYLERALESPAAALRRGELLHLLGLCEQLCGDARSIEHLRAALELTADPRRRAEVAMALAGGLLHASDLAGSHAVLEDALTRLDPGDRDLAAAVTLMSAHAGYGDPGLHQSVRATVPRIHRLAAQGGPATRELNVFLAMVAAVTGEPAGEALALLGDDLDGGSLAELGSSASMSAAVAVTTLVFLDQLDRAEELAAAMLADARRRGVVLGFVAACAHLGLVALRRGDLPRAEAETRAALDVALQYGLQFTIPFTLTYLGETLLERGAAPEALGLIEQVPLPPGYDATLSGAMLRITRGRLRLATGDRPHGVEDLRAGGAALLELGIHHPSCAVWRSELALALGADDPEQASGLAQEELRDARRTGSPRAVGVALRACGLLARGEASIAQLEHAVGALEDSPARLEHARALVDLGAARRRANARLQAREPLRLGLDLAARCGAGALVERARQELIASGGRPRRLLRTGLDALTASELRVAQLAARGDSNRVIAQALFITPKTVENHLGRIYRKLEISERGQLAGLPQLAAAARS